MGACWRGGLPLSDRSDESDSSDESDDSTSGTLAGAATEVHLYQMIYNPFGVYLAPYVCGDQLENVARSAIVNL